MRTLAPLLLLLLTLSGCSDVVTHHYPTYNDAVKDNLFGRGWLPDFIPLSSFNITTSNDLDLNTSKGEFSFSSAASDAFLSKLHPHSGSASSYFDAGVAANEQQNYAAYEYTKDGYIWVFIINREKGHAIYRLWQSKHGS